MAIDNAHSGMNLTGISLFSALRGAALACAVLALSGCGAGDVQFQGKIFDAVGLNDKAKREAPEITARSGLITPPSLERLPPPGSTPAAPQGESLALINDPDRQVGESAEALALRQKAYCEKHYEPAIARGDASAEGIEGPAGPCRKTIFNAFQAITGEK